MVKVQINQLVCVCIYVCVLYVCVCENQYRRGLPSCSDRVTISVPLGKLLPSQVLLLLLLLLLLLTAGEENVAIAANLRYTAVVA